MSVHKLLINPSLREAERLRGVAEANSERDSSLRSEQAPQSHYQQDMRLRLLVLLRKNVRNDGLYEQTLINSSYTLAIPQRM